MGKFITSFEDHNAYQQATFDENNTPNISLCKLEDEVHYNPLIVPPLAPNNIITYKAPEKLVETTSTKSSGIHTNCFLGSGSSVLTITSHTFENGIGTIVFSDDIVTIYEYAFYGLTTLTEVILPNSITSIGANTFYSCNSLISIDIPNSVTNIDNYAFGYCSNLTSITSLATTAPTIQSTTFRGVKTGGMLTIPSGSSGYDTWMQNDNYYLGLYNWTKVEQ